MSTRERDVAVNLRDFEPKWCKSHELQDAESEDEGLQNNGFKALASVLGGKVRRKQRQQPPRWAAAHDARCRI